MMDTSVLRLVPRSVILSSQERGKMAVIQYEKACTNSYLNLISIRLQGHNVITKGPRRLRRQLLQGFDLHSEVVYLLTERGKEIKLKLDDDRSCTINNGIHFTT